MKPTSESVPGEQAHDAPVSARRSALMARVRGKDTEPELLVRRIAHGLGFRFRLHSPGLPGHPDLAFPRLRKVIFVHGCFWHRHEGCLKTTTPKTRADFWRAKFEANVSRDARVVGELEAAGWKVLVVWECETEDLRILAERLAKFLAQAR